MIEIWALAQIIAIDALMAGDNAIVVGMAASAVSIADRRRVIVLGTVVAVVMRICLALVAVQLLQIVGLRLAGGLLLAYVAYAMYRELSSGHLEAGDSLTSITTKVSVSRAVVNVALADLSMSLDNVLAVAGAADGHIGIMAIGLLISVILMAVAANWIARIIQQHRWVAWLGLVIVVYVAITMIYHGGHEVALVAVSML